MKLVDVFSVIQLSFITLFDGGRGGGSVGSWSRHIEIAEKEHLIYLLARVE
jgi:hypothetical protein